jgi:hypothetical protein
MEDYKNHPKFFIVTNSLAPPTSVEKQAGLFVVKEESFESRN